MGTYTNPIMRDGDFADPFVLRFDGRYYLYCTNADVRCWSSENLIDWTLEGPTIPAGTFGDLVPFAPEVVYSNGHFYMYTSPSGHGHYVLRSDAPTGPFTKVSENFGRGIDGNVLVDDDGRWYYYWAGDEGILGCEMSSPTEFGEAVLTGAYMQGWTEGPFVTKRDGWYHMTLTGNHYLSPGYRINAAASQDPLRGYRDNPLNPILVSTRPPNVGLGHSCSVVGPDLVSHYIVYHNLNSDESRDLNIDRQVWNRQALQVYASTAVASAPCSPDHHTRWGSGAEECGWVVHDGGLQVVGGSAELTGEDASATWDAGVVRGSFTSEHNLRLSGSGSERYGIAVSGPPGGASFKITFDPIENAVSIVAAEASGASRIGRATLPADYAHAALHCCRLEYVDGTLRVFLDDRYQLGVEALIVAGSRLGVFVADGTLSVGYVALTHAVEADAAKLAAKVIPGRFWAALTPSGEATVETVADAIPHDLVVLDPQSEVSYRVETGSAATYTVFLVGELRAGSCVEVEVDELGAVSGEVEQPGHVIALPVYVPSGAHTVRVRALAGRLKLDTITFDRTVVEPRLVLQDPTDLLHDGKKLLGDDYSHDCVVDALLRVKPETDDCSAGVIFRAAHLAEGGEGDDPRLGINFFLGYSVQLHADRLALARHDYDERVLVQRDGDWDLDTPHRVVVTVRGGDIRVQVDETEVIKHQDPRPHLVGGAGLRVLGGAVAAERFSITAPPPSGNP